MNTRSNGPPANVGKRVQRRTDDHLHPIGDARSLQVHPGDLSVLGLVFQRDHPSLWARATRQPNGAEATECADLEDAARLDGTGQQAQELALLCRHRDAG